MLHVYRKHQLDFTACTEAPPQLIACCHEDVTSLFSNTALKPATRCDNNLLQLLQHKVITGKTGNNARLTLGEPDTRSV